MPEHIPRRCEAARGYPGSADCGEPAHWIATYDRHCLCWPETKAFCPEHAVKVLTEWNPPYDSGICPEPGCNRMIRLVRMAVIAGDTTRTHNPVAN